MSIFSEAPGGQERVMFPYGSKKNETGNCRYGCCGSRLSRALRQTALGRASRKVARHSARQEGQIMMTQDEVDDATVLAAIERYFKHARSMAPRMSMESLSTALSGRGQQWGTKECFDWCSRNETWLLAHGFEFYPKWWSIGRP